MPRADGDTWDLATSVGATATMVAAARALATRAAAPLIHDQFAEALVRGVGIDFFTRWANGELDIAAVDGPGAPMGIQRTTDVMAARTRYFDAFLLDAAATGIRQAVILASGLDSRAYRLSWPAGTMVFELDQRKVIDFKAAKFAELGVSPKVQLRSLPVDLRQDWPDALRRAGFDPSLPSAWTAEGLLPFLTPQAQDRLLDSITMLSAAGSRLATDMFLQSADSDAAQSQDPMGAVVKRWAQHGLDVDLSGLAYAGVRDDVDVYLTKLGWTSVRTSLRELLGNNGLLSTADDPDATTIPDNYYCTSILSSDGQMGGAPFQRRGPGYVR